MCSGISRRFEISILDLRTMKKIFSPVAARFNGEEVTEEMLREQIKGLNYSCDYHGGTLRRTRRLTVFDLVILH